MEAMLEVRALDEWLAMCNQSKLARELGIDKTTVHRWVKKRSTPSGISLLNLAKILGIRPEQIRLEDKNNA